MAWVAAREGNVKCPPRLIYDWITYPRAPVSFSWPHQVREYFEIFNFFIRQRTHKEQYVLANFHQPTTTAPPERRPG